MVGDKVHLVFLPGDSKAKKTSITTSIEQAQHQKMLLVCGHKGFMYFMGRCHQIPSPQLHLWYVISIIIQAATLCCHKSNLTVLVSLQALPQTMHLLLTDLFKCVHFSHGSVNRQMYKIRKVLKTFPSNRSAFLKLQPYSCLQL
jgi:hypothetical protein